MDGAPDGGGIPGLPFQTGDDVLYQGEHYIILGHETATGDEDKYLLAKPSAPTVIAKSFVSDEELSKSSDAYREPADPADAPTAAAEVNLNDLLHEKKVAAARAMHSGPNCGRSQLNGWPSSGPLKGAKPFASHLVAEVLRRAPGTPCKTWQAQRLADHLCTLAPLNEEGACAAENAGASGGASPPARALPCSSQRWSMLADGPRLLNVIKLTKEKFLSREAGLSRSEVDAKKLKEYWNEAAEICMSDDPRLDEMPGTAAQRARYAEKGLSATYSGYVFTGEVVETKFKEMRRQHMAVLPNFRKSGMGNDFVERDKDGNVSVETAMTVHSDSYYDFCRNMPILWLFYDLLIDCGLMASACSFLPAGAQSSSTTPGQLCAGLVRSTSSSSGDGSNSVISSVSSGPKRTSGAAEIARAIATELDGPRSEAMDEAELDAARSRATSEKIKVIEGMSRLAATFRKRATEEQGLDSPAKRKLQKRAKEIEAKVADELDKCFGIVGSDSD